MNLGKRILSVKGNEYRSALRNGRAFDAIEMIAKDYTSIIDDILQVDILRDDDVVGTPLKKILKFSIYSMSNYGRDSVYYDFSERDEFYNDYRMNLKINGMYLPDAIDVGEFLFNGLCLEPSDFSEIIEDEEYGSLQLATDIHTVMSNADLCADLSVRLQDADSLVSFMEICYDIFINSFSHLSYEEELDAIRYVPYTILTNYISTILFTISEELAHDIIRMYTKKYSEFKEFQIFESEYVYSYPQSILECVQKDEFGMLFLYNYREVDEESLVLTCISMMFKNYLERRLIL